MTSKIIPAIKRLAPRKIINFYHLSRALLAVGIYGYPARRLKVIGVTGTDGKTTTANAIYTVLKSAEKSVALVSTIGTRIGSKSEPLEFHITTPEAFIMQRLLREITLAGGEYAVIETTSHGLDQHRVFGCNFKVGVITNVTPEHLDYHNTFENYLLTKAKILRSVKYSILNRDDDSFSKLMALSSGKVLTYGIHPEADVRAVRIDNKATGMTFEIPILDEVIETGFIGEYNVNNLLAAATAGIALGIDKHLIAEGLRRTLPPMGRLERVDAGQDFSVFIDFAHTPNALASVLKLLRGLTERKLIVVFGCAGERDRQKRNPMGEIAAHFCDYVVITAEDPRTESLEAIMHEIAVGCEAAGGIQGKTFFHISDRQEAINYAIQKLAQLGDIIVVTGKAHEQSMCFGTTEYPWDEFEAVRRALAGVSSAKRDKWESK